MCTIVVLKTERQESDRRNKSHAKKTSHEQLHLRSSLFSIRRTLPVVHWLTVIISQTQTLTSDTQINGLHRHFSAPLSENSNFEFEQPFPSLSENQLFFEDRLLSRPIGWRNATITRLPGLYSGSIKIFAYGLGQRISQNVQLNFVINQIWCIYVYIHTVCLTSNTTNLFIHSMNYFRNSLCLIACIYLLMHVWKKVLNRYSM